ncbi:hypothetical protein PoB_007075200 [Plakobranchus ocellatus]|uniref:Mos1 transposase HTH domain-containing protein n=1 Tax=Plakobranchus ocellatus TaxID=259542 RepID=A0AAV4DJ04_9GAST|nr:hypothetical protein PoB_007075200 [Plakobranchus ocellatus]
MNCWLQTFKCGHFDVTDEPYALRPQDMITEENVLKIRQIVFVERRITINKLVRETKISRGSDRKILHDHLSESKVSARWMATLVDTRNETSERGRCCKLLQDFKIVFTDFFYRLVTGFIRGRP